MAQSGLEREEQGGTLKWVCMLSSTQQTKGWKKTPERPPGQFVEVFSVQTGCSDFIFQGSKKYSVWYRQSPLI